MRVVSVGVTYVGFKTTNSVDFLCLKINSPRGPSVIDLPPVRRKKFVNPFGFILPVDVSRMRLGFPDPTISCPRNKFRLN